ncbi:MAG: oligosaccharide flippase family protein [Desulfomicrobium sp.]
MRQTSFHKIIFRNSIVNTLRYIVNYSIIFVLTPIIIKGVGDAQYGLWALIFSLIGYAGLLDLGVQQATIKLVSEFRGKNDLSRLNEIISSTLFYFFCLGLFAGLVCWLVLPQVMHHFVKDEELITVAVSLLFVLGIDVVFVFIGNVFTGIVLGMHKYHFKGVVDVFCGIFRLVLTVYALNNGYGLMGLAWIALSLDFVSTFFLYIFCICSSPSVSVSFKYVKRSAFKEIFSFGGKVFLASTSMRINNHTTVVLISYFLTTTMTAYYNVASRLVGSARDVVWSLTASLFPVFSELTACGDRHVVWKYYAQYTRLFILVTLPIAFFLLFFGEKFISLWISGEYAENTRYIIMILSINMLVAGLQPLAARLMIGGGEVSFYTKATVVKSLGVLVLSVPLILYLGLVGPPLAMLLGECVYQFFLFFYLMNCFRVDILTFIKSCYFPTFIPLVSIVIFFKLVSLFVIQHQLFISGLLLALFVSIYVFLCFLFSLTHEEKKVFCLKVRRQ